MAAVINAVSKYHQTKEALQRMAEKALGKKIINFEERELAGGLCNAVYLIEAEGEKFVLKIAPENTVKMMRHERGILKTEASVLKTLEEKTTVRAPKLVYYDESCSLCNAPYFIMTFLEGTSLATMNPRPEEKAVGEMKREIGVFCRQMCDIKETKFGIPAIPETFTDNNCDFIVTLFQMLLEDAKEKDITIPRISNQDLLMRVESQREILNEASVPCLIHTDTWDGNLMVKDNTLTGLVDFAAVLYGDPLMTHDFHDFSEEPREEFLQGFGKRTFTRNEKIRINIYKIWQRLGMIVERGYRGYEDEGMYAWVLETFSSEVERLRSTLK